MPLAEVNLISNKQQKTTLHSHNAQMKTISKTDVTCK